MHYILLLNLSMFSWLKNYRYSFSQLKSFQKLLGAGGGGGGEERLQASSIRQWDLCLAETAVTNKLSLNFFHYS